MNLYTKAGAQAYGGVPNSIRDAPRAIESSGGSNGTYVNRARVTLADMICSKGANFIIDQATFVPARGASHQNRLPGTPLKGPARSKVIHPP